MICSECSKDKTSSEGSNFCKCRRGYYYLKDPIKQICGDCPNNANCSSKNGATIHDISPVPGFWRSSSDSDTFHDCTGPFRGTDSANERCCPGDTCLYMPANTSHALSTAEWQNLQCGDRYHGALCTLCKENFARSSDGLCKPCDPPDLGLALGLFFMINAIFAILVFYLVSRIETVDSTGKGEVAMGRTRSAVSRVASTAAREKLKESSPIASFLLHLSGHIGILITWMQILSAVTSSADAVEWPKSFVNFSFFLGIVVNLDIMSLLPAADCRLTLPYDTQMFLHLATPFGAVFSIMLGTACAVQMTRRLSGLSSSSSRERRKLQNNFGRKIMIAIILLMYPSLSRRVFQSFRCFHVEDVYYFEANFAVECYSSDHVLVLVMASLFLLFFVAGVPIILLWELWRHRDHLHDPTSNDYKHVNDRLGFLYDDYEVRYLFCVSWGQS
jgi:hypothetical protein